MMRAFLERLVLKGTCTRRTYFLVGCIFLSIKYTIDRWTWARAAPDQMTLLPWSYLDSRFQSYLLANPSVLWLFVCTSLIFLWVGVTHTILRLRDGALPVSLVLFFFIPFLNLIFFALLSGLPSQRPAHELGERLIYGLLPQTEFGMTLFSVFSCSIVLAFFVFVSTNVLAHYGGGLFLGVPFCSGFSSVLLVSRGRPISLLRSLSLAFLTTLTLGFFLILVSIEGILCVLMAAPIGFIVSAMGALLAWLVLKVARTPVAGINAFGLLALILFFDARFPAHPPHYETTTTIEVDSPPEKVWEHVVRFSDITDTPELLFRLGIAYPVRARIEGTGVGAIRHCEFSTGAFVEPITVWDEPRELRFDVTQTPPPLEEWSPWGQIQPAHIEGYFVSKGGRFILEPLANNRTLLHATTWHQHRIWPASYWRRWADLLIHRIHLRVLNHIKDLAATH